MRIRILLMLAILLCNVEVCYGGKCFSCLRKIAPCPCLRPQRSSTPPSATQTTVAANAPKNTTPDQNGTATQEYKEDTSLDFEQVAMEDLKTSKHFEKEKGELSFQMIAFSDPQECKFLSTALPGAILGNESYQQLDCITYKRLLENITGPYSKNTFRFFMNIDPQYTTAKVFLTNNTIKELKLHNLENPMDALQKVNSETISKLLQAPNVTTYINHELNNKIIKILKNQVSKGNAEIQDAMKGNIIDGMMFLEYLCQRLQLMIDNNDNNMIKVRSTVITRSKENTENKPIINYVYLAVLFTLADADIGVKYYAEGGLLLRFDFEENIMHMYLIRPGISMHA